MATRRREQIERCQSMEEGEMPNKRRKNNNGERYGRETEERNEEEEDKEDLEEKAKAELLIEQDYEAFKEFPPVISHQFALFCGLEEDDEEEEEDNKEQHQQETNVVQVDQNDTNQLQQENNHDDGEGVDLPQQQKANNKGPEDAMLFEDISGPLSQIEPDNRGCTKEDAISIASSSISTPSPPHAAVVIENEDPPAAAANGDSIRMDPSQPNNNRTSDNQFPLTEIAVPTTVTTAETTLASSPTENQQLDGNTLFNEDDDDENPSLSLDMDDRQLRTVFILDKNNNKKEPTFFDFTPFAKTFDDVHQESTNQKMNKESKKLVPWNPIRSYRWNGINYEVGKCYAFHKIRYASRSQSSLDTYEKNDQQVIVSIEKLHSRDRDKTRDVMCECRQVVSVKDTILADLEEYPFDYCCLSTTHLIHMDHLGQPSSQVTDWPEWVHEPASSLVSSFAFYIHRRFRTKTHHSASSQTHTTQNNSTASFKKKTKPLGNPRVAEFFVGAGGMSLGFHRAQFDRVLCIDHNSDCMETLQQNSSAVGAIYKKEDVRSFFNNPQEIDKWKNKADHVHFSPPCQGFSICNRNGGQNDKSNNDLSLLFPGALESLDPLTATYENVTGLLFERHRKSYFLKLIQGCLKAGYQIRCCVLRSSDFGDAQDRNRVFLFCAKKHIDLPHAPLRSHAPWEVAEREGKYPHRTASEAIGKFEDHIRLRPDGEQQEDAIQLEGQQIFNCQCAPINPGWIPKLEHESISSTSCYLKRLQADLPARTVIASSMKLVHYSQDRLLSPREAATLQSFPVNYTFAGSNTKSVYRQVGNAVPIELATAVARSVCTVLK